MLSAVYVKIVLLVQYEVLLMICFRIWLDFKFAILLVIMNWVNVMVDGMVIVGRLSVR